MKGHKEVFEALRREILAGKYDADRRLQSEMAPSRRFGVSRPTASRATLGLTTMRQPLDAIAEVAMQTLVSRNKSPGLPPRTILLDAELVVR